MSEWQALEHLPKLLEWFAVLLAIAYVWLAARQNVWCWLCAFVSTAIYTWLFWQYTLPFQAGLNIYYMLMAVYGWYQWNKPQQQDLPVSQWPWVRHVVAIILLSILSYVLATFFADWFTNEVTESLYLDVFTTIFSVFTTVLVAHKVLENWIYWIVINAAIAYLTFGKGMYPTGLLYVAYVGFAVYGYLQWKATSISEPTA